MTTTINAVNVHIISAPLSEPFGFSQGWVTNRSLEDKLITILREQDDPRIVESSCRFEKTPYAGTPLTN